MLLSPIYNVLVSGKLEKDAALSIDAEEVATSILLKVMTFVLSNAVTASN